MTNLTRSKKGTGNVPLVQSTLAMWWDRVMRSIGPELCYRYIHQGSFFQSPQQFLNIHMRREKVEVQKCSK